MKTKRNSVLVILAILSAAVATVTGQGIVVTPADPFFENFETTEINTLPDGWVATHITGTGSLQGKNWTVEDAGYGNILAHRFGAVGNIDRISTPAFNLSALSGMGVRLEFEHSEIEYAGECDTLMVYYKAGEAEPLVQLAKYSSNGNDYWAFGGGLVSAFINLPQEAKVNNVKIIFEWRSADKHGVVIDNVVIRALVANEASLTSFTAPAGNVITNASNAEAVTVMVRNYGTDMLENFNISYKINNNPIVTESVTDFNLASDQNKSYTFNNKADFSTAGQYTLRAWIDLAGDIVKINDTVEKNITGISCLVDNYPLVESFENMLDECWSYYSANMENTEELGCYYMDGEINGDYAIDGDCVWRFSSYTPASNNKSYSQYLISPQLSTDKVKNISFYCKSSLSGGSINESLSVGYSTTDNDTANFTWLAPYGPPVEGSWNRYIENGIPPAAKYIAVKYMSKISWYSIYIDSLVIDGVYASEADLEVAAITYPDLNNSDLSGAERVVVTVKNNGYNAASSYKMYLSLDGIIAAEENCSDLISPFSTLPYTFTTPVNLSAANTYNIKVWAEIAGDANHANDTVTKIIKNKVCFISSFPYKFDFQEDNFDLFGGCWRSLFGNPDNFNSLYTGIYYDTIGVGDTNYFWGFLSYYTVDNGDYSAQLISPDLAVTADNKIFSFDFKAGNESKPEIFATGYISSTGTLILSDTVTTASKEWTTYINADIPNNAKNIVLKYMSSKKDNLFVDNIMISLANTDLSLNDFVNLTESFTVRVGDTVKTPVAVSVINKGKALPPMTAGFGYKVVKISGVTPVEVKNVYQIYETDIAALSTFNYIFADSAVFTDTGIYEIRAWAAAPNNTSTDTVINAEIAIAAGTIATDLIVEDITHPAALNNQDLSDAERVTVTVKNNGYNDAVSYRMCLSVNGGAPVVENAVLPIIHYKSISYTFETPVNLSSTNTYNLKVWVEIAGDSDRANDTATKTITNVGCIISSYPFIENFEDDLTVCWKDSSANVENAEELGRFFYDEAINGSYVWQFSSYNAGASNFDQYLISPQLSTDKVKTVSFYCKSSGPGESIYESLSVGYSVTGNNIADFTWLAPYGQLSASSWTEHIENGIPPAAKYIAVKYASTKDWYDIYIDSLVINGRDPVAADLAVTSIVSPAGNNTDLSNAEQVTVALRNCGSVTANSCKIYLSVNGATPVEEISTIPIEPYGNLIYTFTNLIDISAEAAHNIKVWVEIAGDADNTNDTANKTVKNKVCPIHSFPNTLDFQENTYDFLDCWSFLMGNPDNPNIGHTGLYYDENDDNYFWGFLSYNTVNNGDYSMYLVSPDLAATAEKKIFSFNYKISPGSTSDETFAVGYILNTDEVIWSYTIRTTDTIWTTFADTAIPGDAKKIIFKYMSDNRLFLFVDNFVIDLAGAGNFAEMPVTAEIKVSVYPNPSDGNFRVDVADRTRMEIINSGGVVLQRKTVSGSSEFLLRTKGLYLLRFIDEKGNTAVRRLIVK
ncbi:MAG: choice-of-anchor J domain-containing protein [Bacteroidales bacterium]|jgi:hypothetical protein|nr:choice-of-anchor J domain-containing protein [Bacteroidales bacterium]